MTKKNAWLSGIYFCNQEAKGWLKIAKKIFLVGSLKSWVMISCFVIYENYPKTTKFGLIFKIFLIENCLIEFFLPEMDSKQSEMGVQTQKF